MAATTETTAGNTPGGSPTERLREAFNRLTEQQRLLFLAAIAAIIAVIVGTILWSRQPNWKVLFSNLNEKDGGAIVAVLEQQNIPHRFNESGSLQVPSERVHEVRLKLASQGLPRGGMVGFELMENQKLGTSQFAEQVNYQRGLEGELARTIQSIGAIESARVHLAIPKPSVFIREEQKPTASVALNLYPGRILDAQQIAGITHLVAASVPQLPTGNVSIIDQNGNLISQLKSRLLEAGLDPTQTKYVHEIENSVIKRIEGILQPLFGSENFKVQVAADVDFSQSEQTAESYRPNGVPENASIRSQQNNETANVNQSTGGVPGALSNQPPVPATAPLTQPPVAGPSAPGSGKPSENNGRIEAAGVNAPLNAAGQPISTSKNATINYELDRTVRHTKQAIGEIRRLSTAVVLNYRKVEGKDGKLVPKPLSDAEIKQVNDLVREAMGFSKERGDTLSVASAPFTVSEKVEADIPLWKDPENQAFLKELIKYFVLAGIIAFLYWKVVQPSLRVMFPPPPEPAEASEDDAEQDSEDGLHHAGEGEAEENVEIDHYAVKLHKAKEISQADPKAVANIIKEWMGGNG